MPNYTPDQLYPGGASPDRPDIARNPTQVGAKAALGIIEQRFFNLRRSNVLSLDPALHDFFEVDVMRLLSIARCAQAWADATNAESSRQASEQLIASMRGLTANA